MKNILLIILLILIILFSPKIKEGLVFPMFCGRNQYSENGKCKAIDNNTCTQTDTPAKELYSYFSNNTTGICTFNKIEGSSDNIVSLKVGETYVPKCSNGFDSYGRYYCHQRVGGPVKRGEASCTKVSDFELPLNWYEAVDKINFKYTNNNQKKSLKYTCIKYATSNKNGELSAENITDTNTIEDAKCKCDNEHILEGGQCRKVKVETNTRCDHHIENEQTCKKAALELKKWTTDNVTYEFDLPKMYADHAHPPNCSSNSTTGVHFNTAVGSTKMGDANDESICFANARDA